MNGHKEIEVVELFGDRIGELLIADGYIDLDKIYNADDDEILAIDGIGISSLAHIRGQLAQRGIEVSEVLPGVLETDATSESEVKPVEVEAKTAEESNAEKTSAVEAVAEKAPVLGPSKAIQNLWPIRTKVVAPSGKTYFWSRAGDVQLVMANDVEFVMSKNRNVGRACCGASTERLYFKIL